MLPLLLYGDLSGEERKKLELHLERCANCRKGLDNTKKLHALLSRMPAKEASEELLRDARIQFRESLTLEGRQGSITDRLTGIITSSWVPRPAMVIAGIALFAFGIVGGRYLFPKAEKDKSLESFLLSGGGMRVTNMQFVDNSPSNEEIVMSFDAVTPVRLRGNVRDPQMQKALAYALVKSENPGVRIRAAGSITAGSSLLVEREVKAALLLALKTDQNDGVRKEAIQTLLRYPPDREVRDALLYVLLHDANPGLRIAAINGLDTLTRNGIQPDEETLRTYRQRLQNDENLYVRVKAQSILKEVRQ
jgi:HEAT repeat protein